MRGSGPAETGELTTVVTEDPEALGEAAGDLLLAVIEEAVAARGAASVVLAGGSTPRPSYARLALLMKRTRCRSEASSGCSATSVGCRAAIRSPTREWRAQRCWDPSGPLRRRSSRGAPGTESRWNGRGAMQSASPRRCRGKQGVRTSWSWAWARTDIPRLSFPARWRCCPDGRRMPVAPRMGALAAAVEPTPERGWRLTLCPDFLRTSRHVVFLVTGRDKMPALLRARRGDPTTPAAWIRGARTHYIVTRDAMVPERDPGDIRFA